MGAPASGTSSSSRSEPARPDGHLGEKPGWKAQDASLDGGLLDEDPEVRPHDRRELLSEPGADIELARADIDEHAGKAQALPGPPLVPREHLGKTADDREDPVPDIAGRPPEPPPGGQVAKSWIGQGGIDEADGAV